MDYHHKNPPREIQWENLLNQIQWKMKDYMKEKGLSRMGNPPPRVKEQKRSSEILKTLWNRAKGRIYTYEDFLCKITQINKEIHNQKVIIWHFNH